MRRLTSPAAKGRAGAGPAPPASPLPPPEAFCPFARAVVPPGTGGKEPGKGREGGREEEGKGRGRRKEGQGGSGLMPGKRCPLSCCLRECRGAAPGGVSGQKDRGGPGAVPESGGASPGAAGVGARPELCVDTGHVISSWNAATAATGGTRCLSKITLLQSVPGSAIAAPVEQN